MILQLQKHVITAVKNI